MSCSTCVPSCPLRGCANEAITIRKVKILFILVLFASRNSETEECLENVFPDKSHGTPARPANGAQSFMLNEPFLAAGAVRANPHHTQLPVDANAKLHRTRTVAGARDLAERGRGWA